MTATAPTPDGAAGVPASTATAPSAPPEADFLRRARENPDWASEQVKSFQSRADRAEAEVQKLSSKYQEVTPFVETYGSPVIKAAIENYIALRNSDTLGTAIQEFERTGQLPNKRNGSESKAEDEEEYLTPEERKIRDLEARLSKFESEIGEHSLASGRTALTQHMEDVFRDYYFTPEVADRIKKTVQEQIGAWSRMGEAGKNALKGLMGPGGRQTVQGIMLAAVKPDDLLAAAQNAASRKRNGLARLTTDGPSGVASTGKEPPPEFRSAFEAAQFARANPDGHDSY